MRSSKNCIAVFLQMTGVFMDDFIKSIQSPAWWIGVAVVGVTLNLISAYLKNPLDQVFTLFSEKYARRSKKTRDTREALIEQFKLNPDLRLGGLTALVTRQWICVVYILTTIVGVATAVFLSGIPSVSIWLIWAIMVLVGGLLVSSMHFFNQAFDLANTLLAAHTSMWRTKLELPAKGISDPTITNTNAES